ncbi:DUF1572 family protein [Pedobacter sp. SL55]|uniref:DUF1572 family protein n=1 Tax=Pedobacter sp. SL55 TaxID=2995161 RepID=UPI002270621C|nr:DUF1572 family protein [Pedobacter sp. SL55]WAC41015.1 DUF1572 family protein [Pedobacter sp. SL55]
MLNETLITLFERDLNRVITELKHYKSEANIWRIAPGIANSAGNLVLHLIGNLNTYIGKEIGKTDFVRNRELEFSQKDIQRAELVFQLEHTIIIIKNSLSLLTEEDFKKELSAGGIAGNNCHRIFYGAFSGPPQLSSRPN